MARQPFGQPFEVLARLRLDAGERGPFLLRLDDADDPGVGVEQVVGEPGGERELADRDAGTGGDVVRAVIPHEPSGLRELVVDPLAGLVFGLHRAAMREGMADGEVS